MFVLRVLKNISTAGAERRSRKFLICTAHYYYMFMKRNKCSGVSTERNDDLKLFQEDKQILIFSTNNIITVSSIMFNNVYSGIVVSLNDFLNG